MCCLLVSIATVCVFVCVYLMVVTQTHANTTSFYVNLPSSWKTNQFYLGYQSLNFSLHANRSSHRLRLISWKSEARPAAKQTASVCFIPTHKALCSTVLFHVPHSTLSSHILCAISIGRSPLSRLGQLNPRFPGSKDAQDPPGPFGTMGIPSCSSGLCIPRKLLTCFRLFPV